MRMDGNRIVRVLAADDSAVMREVLRTIFAEEDRAERPEESGAEEGGAGAPGRRGSSLPRMHLVGVARDGMEAVEQALTLRPDVLVLDLEMPRLNGLGVMEQLRTAAPRLPVILCSTYTEHGARATLDALAHGAQDYVTKPGHHRNYAAALESLRRQLLPKIAALAARGLHAEPAPSRSGGEQALGMARAEVVVIGISTGGPPALERLLPALPRTFPVPVLIVQHMPRLFTGALAERLNRLCPLPVEEARDGMTVEPGRILLAPGDQHMEIVLGLRGGTEGLPGAGFAPRIIRLRDAEPQSGSMPSVDLLFRSAARAYGARTLAVVMTGMGADGLEGARALRAAGGTVLAQDEESSTVWGMPARVAHAGLASAVLPLNALAHALTQRVSAPAQRASEVRREVIYGVL